MTWVAAGMTAAEIAAAEAAAIAAAEIAATEAAAAAATTAATEAAATAAPGILEAAAPEILAPEVLTPGLTPPTGIEQIVPGAGTEILPTASDQALQFANTGTTASDIGTYSQDQSILDMMKNFKPGAETQLSPEVLQASGNATTAATPAGSEGIANFKVPSAGAQPTGYGINVAPPPAASNAYINTPTYNPNVSYASQVSSPYNMTTLPEPNLAQGMSNTPTFEAPQSDLSKGFNSALDWMDKNPFKTGLLGYTALNLAGAFDPESAEMPDRRYKGSLSGYRMSPNFQPSRATPNVYTPRYAAQGGIMMAAGGTYDDEPQGDMPSMASGGIASYASGRKVSRQEELQDYLSMMEAQQAKPAPDPAYVGDIGKVYDLDPDTRYKDALTASMIRMGKINSKGNYNPYQNLKRPTTLGSINLSAPGVKKESASSSDEEREAAAGGIMQADRYNMGGYASGSVPRLLRGPGDGMSDNIPASIDGRQPARLADGEFVVPADVVSHLGNGSTEAGAKKLHQMMTSVRKDRTGNPKQGKQIVAEKYIPKKSKKA